MADREGRLDTKVAIVTGGSSGIGEAIVQRFAREGARVVFCGRNEDTGSVVERAVRSDPVASSAGGDGTFMQCDVTDETAVDALVQRTMDFYGRVDIIVANAGTGGGQLWPDEPTEVWDGFVKLNLNGMMYLCRAAWPHLVASGAGSAIAITSLSAWMGIGRDQLAKMGGAPSASYQASKAAMPRSITIGLRLSRANRVKARSAMTTMVPIRSRATDDQPSPMTMWPVPMSASRIVCVNGSLAPPENRGPSG